MDQKLQTDMSASPRIPIQINLVILLFILHEFVLVHIIT